MYNFLKSSEDNSTKSNFSNAAIKEKAIITKTLIGLALFVSLMLTAPAFAQADAFCNSGASGGQSHGSGFFNCSETMQGSQGIAPSFQVPNNGLGPQGDDATVISGVNTAGTVRVNNLANMEALLNIIANGMEILGIAWGGPTMIAGFMSMATGVAGNVVIKNGTRWVTTAPTPMSRILFGAAGVTGGMATPGIINWLVASARDANLFS